MEIGYCAKCRTKKEMMKAAKKKSKSGRNMMQGVCKKCGTKVTKFCK